MISNFLTGLSYIRSGFSLIRVPGIRRFVYIPIGVNVLVFTGLGWLLSSRFSAFLSGISWLNPDPDTWLGWLVDKFLVLIWVVFGLALLVIFTYTFTLAANLIAAPFNSLLAQRIENYLRGDSGANDGDSLAHIIKSIPHVLRSEVGKLFYLFIWLIPVLLLYIIPGINITAPFVSLLFGAWMLSLEYLDYPMGNNGHLFREIKQKMRENRNLMLGFGSAVTLVTAIPLLNLIAMPVAVAGATQLWVEKLSPGASKEIRK